MAAEREPEWDVGPTEDVVEAFIETLVDPKFPYGCSIDNPPSEDEQKAIARQPFMRTIDGSEATEFSGPEDVLSLDERAVKSACEIANSLDASKDVPTTEGYPISTVAVLLIDSEKENCLLQSDAVTEGVWSLIKKEFVELGKDEEILADEGACIEKKTKECPSGHGKFLQIGFDAVKDVSGIVVSELEVMEAHAVYSLSKEKSAAQFYIMKWKKAFSTNKIFALDSLVERSVP